MEMRIIKEELTLERVAASGQSEAVVEGSVTLPGGLREAVQVLMVDAVACVKRVEAQQDRAVVSGRAMFHVLYTQGEDGRVQSLEAAADFTHTQDLPGCTPRCDCAAQVQVQRVRATASSGQMSLRAVLRVVGRAMLPQVVNVVTGVMGVDGLESCTRQITTRRTVANGRAEVQLREEFDLPAGLDIRETLYATAEAQVQEISGGAGSAGVSGQVQLEVRHASDMPGVPVVITRHTIPFEQRVEPTGEEGDLLAAQVQVADVAVASQDTGEEGRTLRAEVLLDVALRADSRENLTILEDAYTLEGDALELSRDQVPLRRDDNDTSAAESGKAMLMLPEGATPIRQVLCAEALPVMSGYHQAGSRLVAEGTLYVTLLATSREDDTPVSVQLEEPFRITFSAEAAPCDFVTLQVTDVDASAITADRVELRYIMHLTCSAVETTEESLVTAMAQVETEAPTGSIVLYFAQPEDTLWSIAKRYRVPVEEIRRLNPELSGEVQTGQGIVVWHRCREEACM